MNKKEDYRLYEGRPVNEQCGENELKVYDFLDSLNIEYQTLKHPVAFSIRECKNVRDYVKAPVFKNLFLTNKQQSKFYLLLMPGDKPFKTKYLSSQINSARLSFAGEEFMKCFLGLMPGSVSPLGLIFDKDKKVSLLIDDELIKENKFTCHPCLNSASVIMRFNDFLNEVIPATDHEITFVSLPREQLSE